MAETFRVELVGFPGRPSEQAVASLAEAFGLSAEVASTYVSEAPIAVRSGVDRGLAREFTKTLLGIGATVRVVGERSGKSKEFQPDAATVPPPVWASDPIPVKIQRAQPPQAGSGQSAKTQSCPVCGKRQAPAPDCGHCGYAFPKSSLPEAKKAAESEQDSADGDEVSGGHDVDIFENLRTTGERRAIERKKRRAQRRARWKKRKTEKLPTGAARNWPRIVIFSLVAALAVATLVFVVLSPGDDDAVSQPIPDGAMSAPPGFNYRRD